MKKKIWIPIIVVIIIIISIFILSRFIRNQKHNQVQWITTEITRGDLNVVITSTGTIEAVGTVEVGTQISGTISEIFVDFNSKVEKGDTLAILDSRVLRASLYESSANYEKAKIQMEQANRDFQRKQQLYQENLISETEFEAAQDAYRLAKSSLNISQAQLYRTQINLDNAIIKAPISGVVISKNIDEGQTVASSFNTPTLFTIAEDLARMEIQAYVDEADIGEVREDQEVMFDVDAYPEQEFYGIVSQIRLQPVVLSNVVKYIVIIEVNNTELKLMPGMTANLTINIDSREDVMIVPNKALTFMPPQDYLIYYYESLPDSVKQIMQDRRQMMMQNQDSGQSSAVAGNNQNNSRIWIKDGEQIKMIPVKVGLSDGISTEVFGPDLDVDQQVVIGSNLPQNSSSSQRSPFLPSRR